MARDLVYRFGAVGRWIAHSLPAEPFMNEHAHPADQHAAVEGEGTVDPVCGMRVGPDAPESAMYDGVLYRFCSRRCAEAFRRDPSKYVKQNQHSSAPAAARTKVAPAAPGTAAPSGVVYTCPMHPQIRQI